MASANKRLRKALKDSPRVKVVASAPANAKERRDVARQQPAPLLLDAKALDVLTTQVVMGVLGSLTLTSKQRSLCIVESDPVEKSPGLVSHPLQSRWEYQKMMRMPHS